MQSWSNEFISHAPEVQKIKYVRDIFEFVAANRKDTLRAIEPQYTSHNHAIKMATSVLHILMVSLEFLSDDIISCESQTLVTLLVFSVDLQPRNHEFGR